MVAAREVVAMRDRQPGDEPDPREGLTFKQPQVMRLLAKETPVADAARTAGVNEERVRRWTKTRAFRDALAKERSDPSRSTLRDVGGLIRAASKPKPEIPPSPTGRRSKALDLLASGSSVTEAAERSGYTRQHLSHLVHQDLEFRAEYERRLAEEHFRRANFFWTIWSQSAGVSSSHWKRAILKRRWTSLSSGPEASPISSVGTPISNNPNWSVRKDSRFPHLLRDCRT